jgi:putative transposase
MAGKREKPEDIVLKLRQVEVLQGQGKSVSEAVRQIGVTIQTYYRWRKERAMSAIGPRTMASAA